MVKNGKGWLFWVMNLKVEDDYCISAEDVFFLRMLLPKSALEKCCF
jgi:hypothetical protein